MFKMQKRNNNNKTQFNDLLCCTLKPINTEQLLNVTIKTW